LKQKAFELMSLISKNDKKTWENYIANFNNFSIFILNNIFNTFVLILWVLSVLAELNRTPFDLLEGESELVSRFNTEFGSRGFTLLFIREYISL